MSGFNLEPIKQTIVNYDYKFINKAHQFYIGESGISIASLDLTGGCYWHHR